MKNFIIKNWAIILVIVVVVLVSNWLAAFFEQRKVDAIRDEQAQTIEKTAQYREQIAAKDATIQIMGAQLADLTGQLEQARAKESEALARVAVLETEKQQGRIDVLALRTSDATYQQFKNTFPALANAQHMGVTDLEVAPGITIPYLAIPLDFVTGFILDKQELDKADAQLAEFGGITQIRTTIDTLTESRADLLRKVATLEAGKYTACDGVRQDMTRTLIDRQNAHIDDLRRPRFDISRGLAFTGGALLGGFAGWFVGDRMCGGGDVINVGGDW